jgi:hypothetical protein
MQTARRRWARRLVRTTAALVAVVAGVTAIVAWTNSGDDFRWDMRVSHGDYAQRASTSVDLLEDDFYNGSGLWHMCEPATCFTKNRDWGSDALTYDLYLRWLLSGDHTVPPLMGVLARTSPYWAPAAKGTSDTVMWDAVADVREYQVTGSEVALAKAKEAFRWVDSVHAAEFATGACPGIQYQWPHGSHAHMKTLETSSNYVKAALLLYQVTGQHSYLAKAEREYAEARRYFLVGSVPLYTVYVFDSGTTCRTLPGRYFASVNGNMIWAGQALAKATGSSAYLRQAISTARAVAARLSDSSGVFADLQADNDVVEPLIEAMYDLASAGHQSFAARWLMTNASASGADSNSQGEFGRFFDGPPSTGMTTAWQVNGGVALAVVAAALDPGGYPADPAIWEHARYVPDSQGFSGPASPGQAVRITFTGRAIAILGTVGAACCDAGHARVYVDGRETYDRTGIWQNMTAPSVQQPDQVLFAWRWPTAGRHVIAIRPGSYDAEEGGSFFSMNGYLVAR